MSLFLRSRRAPDLPEPAVSQAKTELWLIIHLAFHTTQLVIAMIMSGLHFSKFLDDKPELTGLINKVVVIIRFFIGFTVLCWIIVGTIWVWGPDTIPKECKVSFTLHVDLIAPSHACGSQSRQKERKNDGSPETIYAISYRSPCMVGSEETSEATPITSFSTSSWSST